MTFRWQTDEDNDDAVAQDRREPGAGRRLPRAVWLIASIAVVALIGFVAWRTLEKRAAETEARLRDDVLSVHGLASRAAGTGDDELYLSLLPAGLEGWRQTQQQLLQDGLAFAGAARFYDLVPLPGNATAGPEVTFDPTLSRATVSNQRTFALTGTAHLSQSITLRQMHTYSLGDAGWQLAPPPPDFWVPDIRLESDILSLEYPRRDEAVALRLLDELNRLLPDMCALPGMRCPSDLHLTLRLVSDPASLARAAAPNALLEGDLRLDLPAPSLVGQPLDANGQALVARAYAAQTLAPLISYLSGYECCNRSLLVRAILERQLHHLGLRPWPLGPDAYEQLLEDNLTLGDAMALQSLDGTRPAPEAWRYMLSIVEFLENALPPGALLTNLQRSLDRWIVQTSNPGAFAAQWAEFVYDHSRSAQVVDALDAPPRGTIQLTCYESEAVAVLRYDLQAGHWRHSLTYTPQNGWQVVSVVPLPADYGDVIKEARNGAGGERIARYLWRRSGGSTVLFETEPAADSASLFAPYDGSTPHWRYTVLSPDRVALRASVENEWWQLNLSVCDASGCRPQERLAQPHWSPDGAQLLLEARPLDKEWNPEELTVVHSGSRGQNAVSLGPGYSPVWLSDAHYAYLRAASGGLGQELFVAAAADDSSQLQLTSSELLGFLGEQLDDVRALYLDSLQASPADPHLLLLRAWREPLRRNAPLDNEFLLALQLTSDWRSVEQVTLLHGARRALETDLSPNGRWLAVTDYAQWTLFDLENGERRVLGGADSLISWSPDGNWLAQLRENHLLLRNPALGYKRPLIQDLADCMFSSLQWQ